MEIKTSYPLIIDNEKLNMNDYYSNAAGTATPETYSAGDLTIKTSYPVVLDGSDVSPFDYYSNADDATPTMEQQASAKQKGLFWDKTKGTWAKIANNPGAQFALEKIAEYMKIKQGGGFVPGGGLPQVGSGEFVPDTNLNKEPESKPMTMTTKIIIGVAIAAVLGFVGYSIFAKGNK